MKSSIINYRHIYKGILDHYFSRPLTDKEIIPKKGI